MQLANTVRDSVNDAIDDDLNGAGNPEARFYVTGGATPANAAATIALNTTNVFNASSGGSMTINTATALTDTNATGNASPVTAMAIYANTADAANAWLLQFGIGTATGADVTMSNTTIGAGDTVEITSLTISCPAGSNVTA